MLELLRSLYKVAESITTQRFWRSEDLFERSKYLLGLIPIPVLTSNNIFCFVDLVRWRQKEEILSGNLMALVLHNRVRIREVGQLPTI
jgi:hypothetical protein